MVFPIKVVGDYAEIFVQYYSANGVSFHLEHDVPHIIMYVGSRKDMPEEDIDDYAVRGGHPRICIPKEDISDYDVQDLVHKTIIDDIIASEEYSCGGPSHYTYLIEDGHVMLSSIITSQGSKMYIRTRFCPTLGTNVIRPDWDDITYLEPIE